MNLICKHWTGFRMKPVYELDGKFYCGNGQLNTKFTPPAYFSDGDGLDGVIAILTFLIAVVSTAAMTEGNNPFFFLPSIAWVSVMCNGLTSVYSAKRARRLVNQYIVLDTLNFDDIGEINLENLKSMARQLIAMLHKQLDHLSDCQQHKQGIFALRNAINSGYEQPLRDVLNEYWPLYRDTKEKIISERTKEMTFEHCE